MCLCTHPGHHPRPSCHLIFLQPPSSQCSSPFQSVASPVCFSFPLPSVLQSAPHTFRTRLPPPFQTHTKLLQSSTDHRSQPAVASSSFSRLLSPSRWLVILLHPFSSSLHSSSSQPFHSSLSLFRLVVAASQLTSSFIRVPFLPVAQVTSSNACSISVLSFSSPPATHSCLSPFSFLYLFFLGNVPKDTSSRQARLDQKAGKLSVTVLLRGQHMLSKMVPL